MRYMIRDSHLGFVVKDPDLRVQCHYDSGAKALDALRNGIGSDPTEILRREVYTPAIDVLQESQRLASEGELLASILDDFLSCVDRPSGAVRPTIQDVARARAALTTWRKT